MEGYIKLYRQLMESQVFANQTALKIWIWCLLKASRKERFFPLKIGKGIRTIKILPGQFIFGRHTAEDELNIDGSTIYRWIKKFESDEFSMISIEANNQYSIISICNWDNYQTERTESEQPMSNQRARHEPDMNTDKTVNTVKNTKEAPKRFIKPSVEEIKSYCSEAKIGIDENKFLDHYESNGWKVGKVQMKDWKATVRKWGRSTFDNPVPQPSQTQKTPAEWLQ